LSIVAALAVVAIAGHATAASGGAHFANADDAGLVAAGRAIYMPTCSSCHGRRLQGQALWQVMDRFAGRRAPAHDASGHTWQHSDEDLFHMTKFGRFSSAPAHAVSFMPAFGGHLTDRDILSVLAFIKSSWPVGIRASQAMLNPGWAGMPKDAGKSSWTLPPNCTGSSFQQWSVGAK
jgi:mono/diheme cytochrome c family protein